MKTFSVKILLSFISIYFVLTSKSNAQTSDTISDTTTTSGITTKTDTSTESFETTGKENSTTIPLNTNSSTTTFKDDSNKSSSVSLITTSSVSSTFTSSLSANLTNTNESTSVSLITTSSQSSTFTSSLLTNLTNASTIQQDSTTKTSISISSESTSLSMNTSMFTTRFTTQNTTLNEAITYNTWQTVGILVGFGVAGIIAVSGALIYIWVKTKKEENKYVTLAELNTAAPRPPSPDTGNTNEDFFTNSSNGNRSQVLFTNPAFDVNENASTSRSKQTKPVISPNKEDFRFNFDDLNKVDSKNGANNNTNESSI